jgi:hypothetical protein
MPIKPTTPVQEVLDASRGWELFRSPDSGRCVFPIFDKNGNRNGKVWCSFYNPKTVVGRSNPDLYLEAGPFEVGEQPRWNVAQYAAKLVTKWRKSAKGKRVRLDNKAGYENVLAYGRALRKAARDA